MNLRRPRQLIVPVVLCAAHTLVPLPAAGQSGAGVDDPQQVAEALAEGLVSAMLRHPILGERVALQPLDPRRFSGPGLNKRMRQQLYDLLVVSLRSELRESYKLVDPSRFTDIARILEERGESDWLDRYMELLRDSDARINIVCTASASALSRDRFKTTCTAVTMEAPVETLGTGVGEFGMEWLTRPMASVWTSGNCERRVLRGGSWYDEPRYLRFADRNRYATGNRNNYIGFRIVRTL